MGAHGLSPASVSVVIPVLNDARALACLLESLGQQPDEILVVDGGSRDRSQTVAAAAGVRLLTSAPGRGHQLGEGARAAQGDVLWLLHADTRLLAPVERYLALLRAQRGWGRFDVRLSPATPLLRLVALLMNRRSRLTRICTGDQGMFVHRDALARIGGVPDQPLMEDIEMSRRLRPVATFTALALPLETSARRWQERGVLRTILAMWWLRARYWAGAAPTDLVRDYYDR